MLHSIHGAFSLLNFVLLSIGMILHSVTDYVIQLHEFFSEIDELIFKISKDRDKKVFDTRRYKAFLVHCTTKLCARLRQERQNRFFLTNKIYIVYSVGI